MKCDKCGCELKNDMLICPNCGSQITPRFKQNSLGNIEKSNMKKKKKKNRIFLLLVVIVIAVCGVMGWNVLKENDEQIDNYEITEPAQIDSHEAIESAQIGDTIVFGTYKGMPVEWIVLDEKDGANLVVTKYLLDKKEYNQEFKDVTWESCSLRNWLNNEFYNSAFTKEEQEKILHTKVENKDNEFYGTDGGEDTEDYVFLLSIDEERNYFKTPEQKAVTYADGQKDGYYLRSPGVDNKDVAGVNEDGVLGGDEYGVDRFSGIRPAMWIYQ